MFVVILIFGGYKRSSCALLLTYRVASLVRSRVVENLVEAAKGSGAVVNPGARCVRYNSITNSFLRISPAGTTVSTKANTKKPDGF